MTKLDNLIKARENLEAQLILREEIAENFGTEKDAMIAEELRGMIYSLRWAERICRAAIVVEEERTPEGVSDTVLDELVKATRS
jgi:hypothetical protein